MRLKKVHVRNFRCVHDAGEFEVGDITCLVGKNEAGKSTLLDALYRVNPVRSEDATYDVTDDYPRSEVEDYRFDVERGRRQHARVASATFELEEVDTAKIVEKFGADVLSSNELRLTRGYENRLLIGIDVRESAVVEALAAELPGPLQAEVDVAETLSDLKEALEALKDELKPQAKAVAEQVAAIAEKGVQVYVYDQFLEERTPKFLYFDEYYQLKGQVNIERLMKRVSSNGTRHSDLPLLSLINLARLELKDVLNPSRTEYLHSRLEGAANKLTKTIVRYWSQNRHLQLRFSVEPGRPEDPEEMRDGHNLWVRIYNPHHSVTTLLGKRSRGFVWFLSFLAWFSEQKREQSSPIILLLDEPGLFLHAKAQSDLLRFVEEELKPEHQVLYTTHSPFMVAPNHFSRVRIVEDQQPSVDDLEAPRGTRVLEDVLHTSQESLFPLQGALGYELTQTLFIGPHSLLVEGVSDLLVLQTCSEILRAQGRTQLDPRWTITPVGGAEKVQTFVALLGAQNLNVVALLDYARANAQTVENLFKRKLLNRKQVLTFSDFTDQDEADLEDMFGAEFYLKLVNGEFKDCLSGPVRVEDLPNDSPRIAVRVERALKGGLLERGQFSHYRPARYFAERASELGAVIDGDALDRFDTLFARVNALLVPQKAS